jgi:hypothetical protein
MAARSDYTSACAKLLIAGGAAIVVYEPIEREQGAHELF